MVWISIVVIAIGTLLIMAVHLPRPVSSFRWSGITLFLSGLTILIGSLVSNSRLEGPLNDLIDQGSTSVSDIPSSAVNIGSDVLTSMTVDFVSGFVFPSIIVMVAGLALLITSFLIRSLRIPFLSR